MTKRNNGAEALKRINAVEAELRRVKKAARRSKEEILAEDVAEFDKATKTTNRIHVATPEMEDAINHLNKKYASKGRRRKDKPEPPPSKKYKGIKAVKGQKAYSVDKVEKATIVPDCKVTGAPMEPVPPVPVVTYDQFMEETIKPKDAVSKYDKQADYMVAKIMPLLARVATDVVKVVLDSIEEIENRHKRKG